jgi:hypothetical protein
VTITSYAVIARFESDSKVLISDATHSLEQAMKELASNVKILLVEIKEEGNGESEPRDQNLLDNR